MLMNFEIDNYVDKGVAIKVVGVGAVSYTHLSQTPVSVCRFSHMVVPR